MGNSVSRRTASPVPTGPTTPASRPLRQSVSAGSFFLHITPNQALPVELIEHVVTATWTLPMPWNERAHLQQRLHLVNRTWHAVTARVVLAHVWIPASKAAIRRVDAQLSRKPRLLARNPVTFRDFCTSLTLRLPRGLELVHFMRDDARPFISSLKHLRHLGLDFTRLPPSSASNLVENQNGLTTLSVIFQLMEYAGGISSVELKLGCPTAPHPEFPFADLRQQQFPSVTRAWLDTDNGPLVHYFLQQCYNIRELRLTCAFYGVVTELTQLLPWLAQLTLVVSPHARMVAPCAHVDADAITLRNWAIPQALKRGLLQPELTGGGRHGTLVLEGASAISLHAQDSRGFIRMMQTAVQNHVKIEFRPLQEERSCHAAYLKATQQLAQQRAEEALRESQQRSRSKQLPAPPRQTEPLLI